MEFTHASANEALDMEMDYKHPPHLWSSPFSKPDGLWVSDGDDWLKWTQEKEFKTGFYKYLHNIDVVNTATVLRISTLDEFDKFCLEYGYIPTDHRCFKHIRGTGEVFDDYKWNGDDKHERVVPNNLLKLGSVLRAEQPIGTGTIAHEFGRFYGQCEKMSKETGRERLFSIRWDLVFEHYAGLVVTPYIVERRHVRWYSGWDISSGVIWDLKAAGVMVVSTEKI